MSLSEGNIVIKFNDVLRNDKQTEFHVFDENFNTKYARKIIDEISGRTVTGRLRGRKQIKFQYTGERKPITIVAIGLYSAQYVSCLITIDENDNECYMNAAPEVMYGVLDQTIVEKMVNVLKDNKE